MSIMPMDGDHQTMVIREAKSPIDFVGQNQIAVNVIRKTRAGVAIWDLNTKQEDHEFLLPDSFTLNGYALTVSPGGKQLAVANRSRVAILSLADGTVLGQTAIPSKESRSGDPQAAAFSCDGAVLAVILQVPVFKQRLIQWSVADGKVIADLDLKLDVSVPFVGWTHIAILSWIEQGAISAICD